MALSIEQANANSVGTSVKSEGKMIDQARNLDEFMKIAFDIRNLKESGEEAKGSHFNLSSFDKTLSFGAKILVVGNDTTMNNFVQEYVRSAMSLIETKNT